MIMKERNKLCEVCGGFLKLGDEVVTKSGSNRWDTKYVHSECHIKYLQEKNKQLREKLNALKKIDAPKVIVDDYERVISNNNKHIERLKLEGEINE